MKTKYYSVTTHNLGDEIHITRDGNMNNTYIPYILIISRDAQGPLFMGILSGGNNSENLEGVKLLPIVFDKNHSVIIKEGSKNSPLILSTVFSTTLYSFIPCTINSNDNFKIEIVKKIN